jgi:ABC-type molybdenum transport system ATPase subunit/photorepair protein PhrA
MTEIFKLIIKQKGLGAFIILVLMSSITIVLTIIASHMVSSLLVGQPLDPVSSSVSFIILFLTVYVLSILSNLLTEYFAQITTAKIAGLVGQSYIKNIGNAKNLTDDPHQTQLEYSSRLTTQLERFRAEYVLPFVNIVSRGFILVITSIYLLQIYRANAVIVIIIIGLIGFVYYRGLSKILRFIDLGVTNALESLGNIVSRITKSYTFLYFSNIKTPLPDEFSRNYIKYGKYRGLNAVVSLIPRFFIETCVVVAIFFRENFSSNLVATEDLVFLAFLLFRLNPHIQILIKNIGTMRMSKTSFRNNIITTNDSSIEKPLFKLPKVILPNLEWDPTLSSIFQVRGASGSGKTTLGYSIAGYYSSLGYSVAFIESNPHLPFSNSREISLLYQGIDRIIDDLHLNIDRELDLTKLSNGERQRLLIGLAIVNKQDIIILDEGLSALDQKHLKETLKILNDSSIPLVFISHHINVEEFIKHKTVKNITLQSNSLKKDYKL